MRDRGMDRLHCSIGVAVSRGIMEACPASMSSDSQRIMNAADATPLDVVGVATKRVLGLEWVVWAGVDHCQKHPIGGPTSQQVELH